MKYLITKYNCCIVGKNQFLRANTLYKIQEENEDLLLGNCEELPVLFNCQEANKNVLQVKLNNDEYFIIYSNTVQASSFVVINHLKTDFYLSISNRLIINTTNENVLDIAVTNLTYSHYEIIEDLLIIYFEGDRKFLVVINKTEVKCTSFYDECNVKEDEKLFMCRLFDSLNHGRVFKIKNKTYEDYLIYLDNYDLNLKPHFLPHIFMDCIKAKNYKYSNNLLTEDIQTHEAEKIETFFPKFDDFTFIENNTFILTNKNALAGIYKFDIEHDKICNIIQLK